jgi:hypothetical protein
MYCVARFSQKRNANYIIVYFLTNNIFKFLDSLPFLSISPVSFDSRLSKDTAKIEKAALRAAFWFTKNNELRGRAVFLM